MSIIRFGIFLTLLGTFAFAQSDLQLNVVSVKDDSDLVTIFKADVVDPFCKEAQICFKLKDSVHVSVRIITPQGEVIRNLMSADLDSGMHKLTWDGKDDNGKVTESGVFIYEIQARQMTRSALLAMLN